MIVNNVWVNFHFFIPLQKLTIGECNLEKYWSLQGISLMKKWYILEVTKNDCIFKREDWHHFSHFKIPELSRKRLHGMD